MNNISEKDGASAVIRKGSFAITDILETKDFCIYPDPMLMTMAIDVPYGESEALSRMACYLRYSSSSQSPTSVKQQFSSIINYCKQHKILITAIYKDEAISRTHSDREGYKKLQEDIVAYLGTEKDIEAVLVYKSDRQARNPLIALQFDAFLQEHGKYMISTTESEFFNKESNSNGELMKMIKIGFNSFYSKQLSELVIRGKTQAIKEAMQKEGVCCHSGGVRLLGYDIVNKLPVINEFEAPIIKEMFERFVKGQTYRQLRQFLKDSGLLPIYYYKHGNTDFTVWSINCLLLNPKFCGVYIAGSRKSRKGTKHSAKTDVEGATVYENGWPAIIDKELFDKAQEILAKRINHEKRKNTANYLLTGFVKCEKCGSNYCGRTSTKKNKNGTTYSHSMYRCSSDALDGCKSKAIRQDELESMVFKVIKKEFYVPNAVKKISAYIEAQNTQSDNAGNPKFKILLGKIAELKNEIQQLVESITKFSISQELIGAISNQVKAKETAIKEYELSLMELGYTIAPKTTYETSEHHIGKVLSCCNIDSEETFDKKNMVLHFIDKVIVGTDEVTIIISYSKFITNSTQSLTKKIVIPRLPK